MTEKNFIKITLASILILIASVYFVGRDTNFNQKTNIEMYYAHVNKSEILDYKNKGIDELMWYEFDPNVGKIDNADDKFIIIKFNLDDVYAQNRRLYARVRNKIAEIYIDGVLIQRNGEVGKNQIFNHITTYYDISIPITHKYEGKEITMLLEAPSRFEAFSVENLSILSTSDIFKTKNVFEITMVFFSFIAIAITGLTSLYLFWMRLNFTNKFYRVLLPTWGLLGFIILTLPYYNIYYPQYEEIFSFVAYIMCMTSLFFITYGLRKTILNTYVISVLSFVIIIMWVSVGTTTVLIAVGAINWSYANYIMENVIIFGMLPMFVLGYLSTKYENDIFRVPVKIFWSYNAIIYTLLLGVYTFTDKLSTGQTLNVLILGVIIGIIVFLSFTINLFHLKLHTEIKTVVSESEVYDSIDISRDNIFYDKNQKQLEFKKHEYNNLSVKYAKALINADMYACSLILKEVPGSEHIEVVYCKNTFENTVVTQHEARYYLLLFRKVFQNNDISTVRRGKNVYLGFKQDNLYYFMIIAPKKRIDDLKFKALVSYTNSIKNTAYNYVITNYIEKAQSDVIRSFGETIEARISSNNIIGITDKFVEFIARALGKTEGEVQVLKTASYIKNIGTIIMDDNYVKDFHLKSDAEVMEAYKRAIYGYDILNKFDDIILRTASIMSRYQFENYDGSGYLGVKGEDIPDASKIIKLAEGMTSALRYNINIEKLFEEAIDHVDSPNFEGQFSPYLISKLRENKHLFKESFDLNDEAFVKIILAQKDKLLDNVIM